MHECGAGETKPRIELSLSLTFLFSDLVRKLDTCITEHSKLPNNGNGHSSFNHKNLPGFDTTMTTSTMTMAWTGFPDALDGTVLLTISITTVCVILVGVALSKYHWVARREPFDGLPSPSNCHWLLGHIPLFRGPLQEQQNRVFVRYANQHGQTAFWVFCLGKRAIAVTDCDDARSVLASTSYRKPMYIVRLHIEQLLGKQNLLLLNGNEWKFHRAAILRSFHPTTIGRDNVHESIMDVLKTRLNSVLRTSMNPSWMFSRHYSVDCDNSILQSKENKHGHPNINHKESTATILRATLLRSGLMLRH